VHRRSITILPIAALFAVVGCTVEGSQTLFLPNDANANVEPIPDNLAEIITNTCSGGFCHLSGQSSGGLNFGATEECDPLITAQNLVGVTDSSGNNPRVQPGDPDSSLLIWRLEASNNTSYMPLGKPPLSDDKVQAFKDWISGLDPNIGPPADTVDPPKDGDDDDSLKPPPGVEPVPENVAEIFTNNCATSGCHSGGAPPIGLSLEADKAAQGLVNVASPSGKIRVIPGDPDNSFLIWRLEASNGTQVMPPFYSEFEPLEVEDIQTIRDWITNLDGTVVPPSEDVVDPPADTTSPPEDTATPPPACVPANDNYTVSFSDIVTVVKNSCVGSYCHGGGAGAFKLGADTVENDLIKNAVGVKSFNEPAFLRIAAGDPDNSYILLKLKGTHTTGGQMPQGGPYFDAPALKKFSDWIADCARAEAEEGLSTGK
jgi:hypothetical protein